MSDPRTVDYFSVQGINWSTLKWMQKSPLAYRHARDSDRPDKQHLAIGRYVHALVFEPESVDGLYAVHDGTVEIDYVVYYGGDRRGKAWESFKAQHAGRTILKPNEAADLEAGRAKCERRGDLWDAFRAQHDGKTLFLKHEAKTAQDMARAVRAHPLVKPYLDVPDGRFEQTLQWIDHDTGLLCKARYDWGVRSLGVLIDLKTARSIEMHYFGKDIARYEYHCQLAHYANGLESVERWRPRREIFIAVEKTPPHDVLVCELDMDAKLLARDTVAGLLRRVIECERADEWPGRYTEEQTAQLPGWVFGSGEPEISFVEDEEGGGNGPD